MQKNIKKKNYLSPYTNEFSYLAEKVSSNPEDGKQDVINPLYAIKLTLRIGA